MIIEITTAGRTYCLVDGQRPDQAEQEELWAEELAGD